MTPYSVQFRLSVHVDAQGEDEAIEKAWEILNDSCDKEILNNVEDEGVWEDEPMFQRL